MSEGAFQSSYIRRLNERVARDQAQRAEKEQADTEAVREKLVSLEVRLKRLLADIPREVQAEGLSLSALQASLRGRGRGRCHPGELGAALRKVGFTRRRGWQAAAGFSARWYPSS